jgi:hypothetical protein
MPPRIDIALFTRNVRGGPAVPQIRHVDGFEDTV